MDTPIVLLPELVHMALGYLTLTGLCSIRLFVVMSIFPPAADGVLQGTVRNAVVLLFSSYIAYGQPLAFSATLSGTTLILIGLREAMIGLVLGLSASSVFWVAESAGYYIDNLSGYNNAQVQNPMRTEQSTPTAMLFQQIAIVAFWGLGGMTFLLGALYESYRWWPLTASTLAVSNVLEAFVLRQTDDLMQMLMKLAAPMVMILVLIDLAFGYAAKSGGKLDVMGMSQPVKGAVTVLMLALFASVFVDQVHGQLALMNFAAQIGEWVGIMPGR